MINFRTITATVALLTLGACQSETPADGAADTALTTCPQDKVISDVTAFSGALENLPDAGLDFAAWHTANGERDGVKTTESGVQYFVVQDGAEGAPSPDGGQIIKANYHGFYPNGDVFDSSFERGSPIEHNANGFIKGWNEMLADMKVCEARTLYVPGDLAYGPSGRGDIPPNATLLFHMQLLSVEP